jgi:hypothetical protein
VLYRTLSTTNFALYQNAYRQEVCRIRASRRPRHLFATRAATTIVVLTDKSKHRETWFRTRDPVLAFEEKDSKPMNQQTWKKALKASVIEVGDGRGFVADLCGKDNPIIITGAHCLPRLTLSNGVDEDGHLYVADADARLYANLLGPIGAKPTVWAECLFVDPVADLAVLGTPDNQRLFDEAEAYEAFVGSLTPFSIADVPEQSQVWLLSLEREWLSCQARYVPWVNGPFLLSTDPKNIKGGMSGSPIVSDTGAAVGVVCLGSNQPECGPHPRLVRDLPGWLSYAHQRRAAKAQREHWNRFGTGEIQISGFEN